MIQYYMPGLDVSQMSDEALARKLGHLFRIRQMEGNTDMNKFLSLLQNAQRP